MRSGAEKNMPLDNYDNLGSLVEPERVHKACYADEQIFENELEKIFYKCFPLRIYLTVNQYLPFLGQYPPKLITGTN